MDRYRKVFFGSTILMVLVIFLVVLDLISRELGGSLFSLLFALAFIMAGMSLMAKSKRQEKKGRKEPFIGY